MKEIFVQQAAHNFWANQLLLAAVELLPEEKQVQEIKSSFPGFYKTVLHLWDAEAIWWQRMRLQERIIPPSEGFTGSLKEIISNLLQQNKLWQDWIVAAQEHALQHEFIYYNSRKEKFKQPVYQMLIHLFHHASFHRGQIVTLLRQVGVEKIPATDFIVWSRKK